VHCGRTGDEARFNVIDVTPAPGARLVLPGERARRGTLSTSACGVCGRQTIDDLLARCTPRDGRAGPRMSREALSRAVASLRERQALFARTGGCHGASLVDVQGTHIATYEDVGRHNAVDKLVGASLLAGRLPLGEHALVVSGRTSFEIVQKAVASGITIVLGVSAASSLAIDVARRAGVALAGFVRGEEMVLYANGGRIT
jgi:FdhD protein